MDGYNISRTLREATRTSRDALQVVDLGLTVAAALAARLEPERTLRKKDRPADLARELSTEEREFFAARYLGRHRWDGRRVELNALTSGALIAYVEQKLRAHGLTAKVLPPPAVVAAHVRAAVAAEVREAVTAEVARLLDLDALAARLSERAVATMDIAALHVSIRDGLHDNPPEPWGALTAQEAVATADRSGVRAAVAEALRAGAVGLKGAAPPAGRACRRSARASKTARRSRTGTTSTHQSPTKAAERSTSPGDAHQGPDLARTPPRPWSDGTGTSRRMPFTLSETGLASAAAGPV